MRYDYHVKKTESNELTHLRELLRTEKFRQALIREDIADDYVLGYNGYSAVSGTVGCRKDQQNHWEVYEVSDDGEQYNIRSFRNQMAAFRDAAKRRGVSLPQSDLLIDDTLDYIKLASNEKKTLDSAIKFFGNLADFYGGSRYGVQIQNELSFLESIKTRIRLHDVPRFTDTRSIATFSVSRQTLPKQRFAFSAPKRAALNCTHKYKNTRAVAKHITSLGNKSTARQRLIKKSNATWDMGHGTWDGSPSHEWDTGHGTGEGSLSHDENSK